MDKTFVIGKGLVPNEDVDKCSIFKPDGNNNKSDSDLFTETEIRM